MKKTPQLNSQFDLESHTMVGDNILIEAIEPTNQSEYGLVDPAQYDDKAEWGRVLSVGKGRVLENGTLLSPEVAVGDIITFGKYSSYKCRVNGIDYLIIRSDDVMSKSTN